MLSALADRTRDDDFKRDPARHCRGQDPNLFFPVDDEDEEPPLAPPGVLKLCNVCPVRPECLTWALERGERGIWGGTTTYQRDLLSRPMTRKRCPTCSGGEIITEHRNDLCVSCGTSWPNLG